MQHGVRAARAAAQAVVVGFDEFVRAGEQSAHGEVAALHVAEVARILDDDALTGCPHVGHSPLHDELGDVAHAR